MVDEQLAPAFLPPGQRAYAIGDVHGCVERLAALHRAIARDLAARPVEQATVIHLGDYLDRGRDPAGVVDLLLRPFPMPAPARAPGVVNLAGNHEDMALAALSGDRMAVTLWRDNGGETTLRSWGIRPDVPASAWADAVPGTHRRFLEGLAERHSLGGYTFVHAGLRPGLPLDQQSRHDMLWIREPFLSWSGPMPAVAVHGHTPARAPQVLPHRIGVDTGAVMGGKLTCVVLEADRLRFLQV